MPKKPAKSLVPAERIDQSILLIRGEKVMLDADLASLYGVETPRLSNRSREICPDFPTISCSN